MKYICVAFDFFLKVFFPTYVDTFDFQFDFVTKFLVYFSGWLYQYNFSEI